VVATQPVPVAVPAQPMYIVQEVPRLNELAPHDFLWLSVMTAAVLGFLNILTLSCTMPAIILSIHVSTGSVSSLLYYSWRDRHAKLHGDNEGEQYKHISLSNKYTRCAI